MYLHKNRSIVILVEKTPITLCYQLLAMASLFASLRCSLYICIVRTPLSSQIILLFLLSPKKTDYAVSHPPFELIYLKFVSRPQFPH